MRNGHLSLFLAINTVSCIARGTFLFIINVYALHIGANLVELGLVRGMTGLGVMVSVLPIGFLVDHYGGRRFFVHGEIAGALLNLALICIETPMQLILLNALIGCTMALRFTSLHTVFLGQLDKIGKHRAGWFSGSSFLGVVFIGPLLGGCMVEYMNYSVIFILTSLLMLLSGVVAYLYLPITASTDTKPSAPFNLNRITVALGRFYDLFGNKSLVHATLIESLNAVCFSVFSTFILVVAIEQFNFTPNLAGYLLSFGGGIYMTVVFLGGRLLNGNNRDRVLLSCFVGIISGLLLLATASTHYQMELGTLVLCLSLGMITLTTITQISEVEGKKGKVVGFYSTFISMGYTFGPIAGGVIGKLFGTRAVFLSLIPLFFISGMRVYLAETYQEAFDE